MKKFVLTAIMIILAMLGLYYAVYYQGFYICYNSHKDIDVIAVAKEKKIYLRNENGEEIPFEIKGVTVSPSIPGHYMSDYAADEKTWIKWFEEIQNMGANAIRIYNVYDDTFYNAYYKYNIDNKEPLYLLQGIQVSDYANNSSKDAYSSDFYYQLKQDAKTAVDVIHGRKNIMLNTLMGSGNYRKDVSKWVLGYLVGTNWDSGTVAYTNHNKTYKKDYDGTYFITDENADVFEAMLADIMDTFVSYEINKYSQSRLVSFINDPSNDAFEYEIYPHPARRLPPLRWGMNCVPFCY